MNSPGTFVRRRAVRPRWLAAAVLAAAGVILAAWPGAASAQEAELPVLARVEVAGPLAGFPLPVHAHLQDKSGQEYLLVYATPLQLTRVAGPRASSIPAGPAISCWPPRGGPAPRLPRRAGSPSSTMTA